MKMRISAKGRYGLAAMTHIATNYEAGQPITIVSISEKLGISKIYLEQVFSLLKRAELVLSLKGSQGGYQLARAPKDITAYDVLAAIETAIVDQTDSTVADKAPFLDKAMKTVVFDRIDDSIRLALEEVTLEDIIHEVEKQKQPDNLMYFI